MMIDPLTIEYRANMTEAPKYSLDSQPSWLTSGWTMERAMDMTLDDWNSLTEDVRFFTRLTTVWPTTDFCIATRCSPCRIRSALRDGIQR